MGSMSNGSAGGVHGSMNRVGQARVSSLAAAQPSALAVRLRRLLEAGQPAPIDRAIGRTPPTLWTAMQQPIEGSALHAHVRSG